MIEAVPLCGFKASPLLAMALPFTNTLLLPAATVPFAEPQHESFSVVTEPTVATGSPLQYTLEEQPPLIEPEIADGGQGDST